MNSGGYSAGSELARALVDRHPHLGFLWKVYGAALLGQAKDALPIRQRAIQLSPDDAETHYYLGTALHDGGDVAGAMACYQRALELRPAYTAAIVDLADLLQHSGRFVEAAAGYRCALEIEPNLPEV